MIDITIEVTQEEDDRIKIVIKKIDYTEWIQAKHPGDLARRIINEAIQEIKDANSKH